MPKYRNVISVSAKSLIATILAMLVVLGFGIVAARAESKPSVNVPGAGNVGYAATYGWGGVNGYGRSTSSVTLYHLYAGARIWHQSTGYNILEDWSYRSWYWSTGGYTGVVSSIGYGDRVSTRSAFLYLPGNRSGVYYTSYPHYSASCSTYWYTGNNC